MSRLMDKQLGGIRLLGFSVAGEETVVIAPEYNVAFDIGRAPRELIPIDNVCLTHGHMDHSAGAAYYFSQRGFVGLPPGRIIVHRCLAQPLQKLMDLWSDIEGHPSAGQVYGVDHLENVDVRRGLSIRAFTVNHSRSSLGFSLIERRHKLKPEFSAKQGPELAALKREGVQIEDHVEVVLLTCTGDTALGRFLDLDFVRQSQTLLVECTFYERDHVSRAKDGRHLHVDDLPQVLSAVPQAQIMLTHVTHRTDLRLAKRILQQNLSRADLERVSFLMERPLRAMTPAIPVESKPT